jgi:adenylylsulfate kinase-like enzyme
LCDRHLGVADEPFSTAVGRDCRRCDALCNRPSARKILICSLPGSGKTSLATALAEVLPAAVVYDADTVRSKLWPDLGYRPEDRLTQARRMGALADMTLASGCSAISAFVAPTQEARDLCGRATVIWVDRKPCRQ